MDEMDEAGEGEQGELGMGELGGRSSRLKSHDRLIGFAQPGFYILLALAEGPASGAEVWWRIVGDTMGSYVKHSSLYDEIRRLERVKLLERRSVGRTSVLTLTKEGERRLCLEMGTLKWVQEVAQGRGLC